MSQLNFSSLNSDARKKYWNEDYVHYWKERVEEANMHEKSISHMIPGDKKTSSDKIYQESIDLLQLKKTDVLLELACGFGRSLPLLCNTVGHVSAVDISEEMIRVARHACPQKNIDFYVSASEHLPFKDEFFDSIICFAAFDAMYQTEALKEMNRVCKIGGKILLTGKNANYCDDDVAAFEAEIGARAKQHPNYFTDIPMLMKNLQRFGFEEHMHRYFLKRGDFASNTIAKEHPLYFYEYLLILKKVSVSNIENSEAISSAFSKTYCRNMARFKS